jgi:hypothetical protein
MKRWFKGEIENTQKFYSKSQDGTNDLQYLSVDRTVIFKWIYGHKM